MKAPRDYALVTATRQNWVVCCDCDGADRCPNSGLPFNPDLGPCKMLAHRPTIRHWDDFEFLTGFGVGAWVVICAGTVLMILTS